MIFNKHLDRLMEVDIVRDFVRRHHMTGKMCTDGDNHSYILYRLPYVIGFWDALIENYLEIVLMDMKAGLLLEGSSALGRSLDLGLQSLEVLRTRVFHNHPQGSIFLSDGDNKMDNLDSNLEAIDKLLPMIEAKGGLASMRDGSFESRFDFSSSIRPIYPGLNDRYLKCIASDE